MKKKKNGFWMFIFSFVPGCGEMYLGFMKMGLSLMVVFFGLFALATWLNLSVLIFAAAVVWFYSFFHARNMAAMSDQEILETEDDYLFHIPEDLAERELKGKYRKWAAILLIIFGVILLYQNVMYLIGEVFYEQIPYEVYSFFTQILGERVPQIVVAVLIILLGVKLISGKKKELSELGEETEEERVWETAPGQNGSAEQDEDTDPADGHGEQM